MKNEEEPIDEVISRCLSKKAGKSSIMALAYEAIENEPLLNKLLSHVYNIDDPLCLKATWAIEKIGKQNPTSLKSEWQRLKCLAISPNITHGQRRLLLNILYNLSCSEDLDVILYNYLLDTMLCPSVPPGVQAIAMKLAYRMNCKEQSLNDEFCCIIRNVELDYYSPAFRSAVKQCLKKSERQ